jgi:hypothetical protein
LVRLEQATDGAGKVAAVMSNGASQQEVEDHLAVQDTDLGRTDGLALEAIG